jgi:hypothetical protein
MGYIKKRKMHNMKIRDQGGNKKVRKYVTQKEHGEKLRKRTFGKI